MRAMRELAEVHASLPYDRPVSLDEAIELRRGQLSGARCSRAPACSVRRWRSRSRSLR
jgi:hypothetical protein